MKLYVTSYQGAGLALVTTDSKGHLRVLLGRRLIGPGLHTWTFPGGKRHVGESPAENALREASEEMVLWPGAAPWPRPDQVAALWSSPFYDWTTFLWQVRNPSLRMPQQGKDLEFEAWGWFRLDRLPGGLHYGVRPALRKIRKTVQAEAAR